MEPQARVEPAPVAISKEEREFFVQLGTRIAGKRPVRAA